MDFIRIFFIIPFYNGDRYIEVCLQSIFKNANESFEVIIVNNSDRPTKIKRIVKDFKNVTVIDTETRIGFAKANNLGAKVAIESGAEYIICLNQDTILHKNAISEMIKPLIESYSIVITAPIPYSYDFTKIESFFIKWYLTQCPDLLNDALNNNLKTKYEVQYISGACFAIRSNFIQKYGFFDPIYFMYAEDEDLCRRVKYLGYKIVIVPNAKFAHYHTHTSGEEEHQKMIKLWQRHSRAIYQLKNIKDPFYNAISRLMYKYFIDYISLIIRFKFITLYRNMCLDIRLFFDLPRILKRRRIELEFCKIKKDLK